MTNTRYIALPSIYGGFFRFTRIKLPGWKKIQRGDIVIFKYPVDERQNFVKRVIGLPGEKVQIKERAVYINGKALYEPYAYFSEAESAYATENRTDPGHHFGPVTVPQNQLFVLGDNRDNSYDSRYWGFVPLKNVFGTPLFSYWSFDNKRHRIRMGEIFKTIQ
jgi:signal peptidase I, bacterial type